MELKQKLAFALTSIFALSSLIPITASSASSDLLFGQQHSYTVTMRGNGEAVVLARLTFTNTSDQPQTTFNFQVPGTAAPSELVGFQSQYAQACNRYGAPLTTPSAKTPAAASSGTGTAEPAILPCLEYAVPDYSQPDSNASYKKLTFASSGSNNYQVTLPTPVPAQQSSSLLLSYATKAYAHQSLGAYTFKFQTLKVNQRVTSVNVAVDVDSDQYLEGKSSVTYQPTTAGSDISSQANSASPSSAALNRAYSNVGQNGEIDKTASDLAPGDTFTVKGRYASSLFLLRLPGLLATFGFVLLVIFVLFVFRKRIAAHLRRTHQIHPSDLTPANDSKQPRPTAPFASAGNLLAGLISALGVCGITWFLSWWSQNASSYSNSDAYSSTIDPFSAVLIFITAILAYLLFGLGPGIYLAATNRDWRRLVYVITFEVLFLVAFVVIYVVGIAPFFSGQGSGSGGGSQGIYNGGEIPN